MLAEIVEELAEQLEDIYASALYIKKGGKWLSASYQETAAQK